MTSKPRVILVGNSHVAALRRGWDMIKNDQDINVDLKFFAANSTLYGQLELSEGKRFGMLQIEKYHPRHVSFLQDHFGGAHVELTNSDAVVLVGTGIRSKDFVRNLSGFSIDGIRNISGLPSLSSDAFHAFAAEIFKKGQLPKEWLNWNSPRLFLLSPPIPSETCPENDKRYGTWARFGAQNERNIEFLQRYHDIVSGIMKQQNVTLITPPRSVQAQNGLTKSMFHTDAKRLNEQLPDYVEDFHHMNEHYGAEVLRHVLETVTADLAAVPAE